MNLNFFPDAYNNTNQYLNQGMNNYIPNPTNDLNEYINKLQGQLSNLISNKENFNKQNTQVGQPYVLYCGNKSDWDEFLILNYGITEQNIFDDYKLFLQAKKELIDEQGQNKINNMKDKIKQGVVQPDATIKSNVKPRVSSRKFNREFNSRNTVKFDNRPNEQNKNFNNKKDIQKEGEE